MEQAQIHQKTHFLDLIKNINNIFIFNHLRESKKALASSSATSAGNSFKATELHFLAFLMTFELSYLQIPIHSPKVAPYLTEVIGI